ncbi:hypothetical protein [Humibacter ginsenosidimutans]|uniref:SAF domain-containing protein n=1 Tax=Humibacter ginsenosidimutans TaxID=2599293 RepID=A0A5B8M9Z4_9MICO|nr:hypothetical protein [Humibacter ginsenosidimutans]QDZ16475.1 hypothetical protein FPZ11_18520 [Humibacter ginsenosidimutans]
MASAPDAKARRLWIDPRFVIGIVLIAASVTGVCLLLAAQNRTVEVYVARDTLVLGDHVTADDLAVAKVRVPASDRYLAVGRMPGSAVVLRTVSKGELVPVSAVGDTAREGLTSVVVTASGPLAASITTGSVVDVWAARSASDKDYEPPVVLAADATVVSVVKDDSLVTDRGSVSVEVRVRSSRVASVLQAIADGRALSVVPAGPDDDAEAADDVSSGESSTASTPAPSGGAGNAPDGVSDRGAGNGAGGTK